MIIPIPWHSADIRLKKLDIRVKPRRQVSKFHADGHGVSRILFLVCRFNRFFYFLRIISVPWYSAVIRVKKLDIRVKACQLANSHGLSLSITDFFFLFVDLMAFLNYPKITFVPWYSAIIRVKKLGHPCEDPSDTSVPFAVCCVYAASLNVRCIL